ncbi:MAG: glycosyltransferase [Thermofilum sp.]|nr:glycosyltransferase [Thermofilum sp.]
MRVLPVTSERSVSLQKVTMDVADVLRESGFSVMEPMLYPDAVRFSQLRFQATYIVMAFDMVWAVPFFYLGYRAKADGKKYVFYTTVEGKVLRTPHEDWVFRELEFVAVSRYVAGKLVEAGARVKGVVYHGVDTQEAFILGSWGPRVRRSLGFSESDFVVGYLAGAYSRKGHDQFAEVIRLVAQRDPSIKFVIVTQPQAQQFYAGCPNTLVLTNFGQRGKEWVWGFYHALDLYAHPALAEGFGLPVLEALASGRAVVHANYEPLSEITTPETSFRVPVIDVQYAHDAMHLSTGILYEHHLYDPQEFAETILQAKDEVLRRRKELAQLCFDRARLFEKSNVYSAIARMLQR